MLQVIVCLATDHLVGRDIFRTCCRLNLNVKEEKGFFNQQACSPAALDQNIVFM
jgi:hypothetical protein